MSSIICHPYHIVDESPWPVRSSFGGLFLTTGIVSWFHLNSTLLFTAGLITLTLIIFQWWRDISREGAVQGAHTSIVELGLRWGMALFIVSEVFFFLRFFWAFFHRRLAPNVEVGSLWPPQGIKVFNPLGTLFGNPVPKSHLWASDRGKYSFIESWTFPDALFQD